MSPGLLLTTTSNGIWDGNGMDFAGAPELLIYDIRCVGFSSWEWDLYRKYTVDRVRHASIKLALLYRTNGTESCTSRDDG
jgi:hypothetical protein